MLIISKDKDYYDSVAHSKGVDKTIVYRRNNKELAVPEFYVKYNSINDFYFPRYENRNNIKNKLQSFDTHLVGFCGKLYPLIIAIYSTSELYSSGTRTEYIYDRSTIESMVDSYCPDHTKRNNQKYFALLNNSKILNVFADHKCPVFLLKSRRLSFWNTVYYSGENLELNPNLKKIEFFKVLDTYTAFQELEMYISGVLGVDSQKTIEVSDKSKIEGHGFDYKTSFRKEKQTKK